MKLSVTLHSVHAAVHVRRPEVNRWDPMRISRRIISTDPGPRTRRWGYSNDYKKLSESLRFGRTTTSFMSSPPTPASILYALIYARNTKSQISQSESVHQRHMRLPVNWIRLDASQNRSGISSAEFCGVNDPLEQFPDFRRLRGCSHAHTRWTYGRSSSFQYSNIMYVRI